MSFVSILASSWLADMSVILSGKRKWSPSISPVMIAVNNSDDSVLPCITQNLFLFYWLQSGDATIMHLSIYF